MSFGPTMVNDVVHTAGLSGARLVLHDVNRERLDRAYRFAAKLNASSGAPVILDRTTDPAEALTGADFVLSSAEFGRFEHWRQDYEIPNRHGARQITGENGGPGAVFHSLRSITNTLGICADIERYCPDAFLINLTNPMSRVTLAINRATKVRNVGMCHEMPMGINRLARRLRVKRSDIEARASGINHFTFFTEFRNKRTGEDLLPTIRAWFEKPVFDYSPRTQRVARRLDRSLGGAGLVEFNYMPLVTHVVREHGLVPCSVDSHIGEYLPFALDVADWMPVPMDFHQPFSELAERRPRGRPTPECRCRCRLRACRVRRWRPSSMPCGTTSRRGSWRSTCPTTATFRTWPMGRSSRLAPWSTVTGSTPSTWTHWANHWRDG
ncbi:MAG: hypothetical protein IPQ14_16130 [Candidatus Microthrix sp.]|nr:hypothetical protein [Candidatus Microthrix sp.]